MTTSVSWRRGTAKGWDRTKTNICYAPLFRAEMCPRALKVWYRVHPECPDHAFYTYIDFLKRTTPKYIQKYISNKKLIFTINTKKLTKLETLACITLLRYIQEKPDLLLELEQNLRNGLSDGDAFIKAHVKDNNTNHSMIPYKMVYHLVYHAKIGPEDWEDLFPNGWRNLRTKSKIGLWNQDGQGDLVNTFYKKAPNEIKNT